MKKITISDIAKKSGVSKSTVSRFLNNGYVKEDTKQKIQKVISETGFEPSAAAQNLKLKQTRTIGVVMPTMTSVVSGRQITAINEALYQEGYNCIIVTTNHDPKREIEAIEYFRSMRVDGIILFATTISREHQKLQSSSKVPFLVMGQEFLEGNSIVYDDYRAGEDIGAHIARAGHTSIAYLGPAEKDEAVGLKRKNGVLSGLKSFGPDKKIQLYECPYDSEVAQKLVGHILDEYVPTCFICATDRIAYACWKEVKKRGYKVPEEISIAGFGGYEISDLMTPGLDSIRFYNEDAGYIAAQTLLSMIHKRPVPRVTTIGYNLQIGGSVQKLSEE